MSIRNQLFLSVIPMVALTAFFPHSDVKVSDALVFPVTTILDVADEDFVKKAADGGLLEVKAAELAVKNAASADVKAFAETMLKDHSKANTELQATAKQKNIETPTALSSKSQEKLRDLSTKTGTAFDDAYARAMVRDHEETVKLFKKEADSGKDADLKRWAAEKLPTLEHHLTMAKDLAAKTKKQ